MDEIEPTTSATGSDAMLHVLFLFALLLVVGAGGWFMLHRGSGKQAPKPPAPTPAEPATERPAKKKPAPAVDYVKMLDSEDPKVRQKAIELLVALGVGAIPHLSIALEQPSDQVRLGALQAILRLGRPASALAPTVRQLTSAANAEIRTRTVMALDGMGPEAHRQLRYCLTASHLDVRKAVVALLAARAEKEVSALVAALDDRSTEVRDPASKALVAVGAKAIPALHSRIQGDMSRPGLDASIRVVGKIGRGPLGEHEERLIDNLLGLLATAKPGTRDAALDTLVALEQQEAVRKILRRLSRHANPQVRGWAVGALQRMPK